MMPSFNNTRGAIAAVLFLTFSAVLMQSCSSGQKTITKVDHDSSSVQVSNADPFTVLDDNGRVDSALVEGRLEAARQEWLRALAAAGRKDKNGAVRRFESSIDILNRLIYYPGVSENKDFQELTRSVFEDYEKYVSKIDVLPPTSSIYAFRQKFNEEMTRMDIRNIPIPRQADLKPTQVPLDLNPAVEKSIAYFMSGNGRTAMTRWLGRSTRFFPMMKKIFAEVGTPQELIYLSMIESGMNPTVTSRAQAVGLWQFIEGTGAMYGLRSNWWFDNKRDPVKETYAAARHLKDLYRAMGDWYLALCCYNCSMTRIRRCMAENQDTTFWGIRDCLPKETQNYIPLYVAAARIAMDPAHYGFTDIQYENAMIFDTVRIKEAVDLNALALAAGTSGLELKSLNTELLQFSTPPPELCPPTGYVLRVPAGTANNFYTRYAELTPEQKRPWMLHTVERGESLRSIARTYGLSTEQLASYNNLEENEKVKRGTRLRVPMTVMSAGAVATNDTPSTTSTTTSVTAPKEPVVTTTTAPTITQPVAEHTKKVSHRVRKGETLYAIATRYGVRLADLRNWNNIGYHQNLKKGQHLTIYLGAQEATTTVAAEPTKNTAAAKKHWIDYKVRRGDTMAKIADDFSVSLAEIKKWNGTKVRHGVKSGQTIKLYSEEEYAAVEEIPVSQKPRVHTVRPGETMTSIAAQYGTTVNKLSDWNDSKEPSSLQAGEKLNVYAANKTASQGDSDHPKPAKKVTYRVRRGDTLYSIAEKYGVGVTDLKSANHLSGNNIPAGKRLVIPTE